MLESKLKVIKKYESKNYVNPFTVSLICIAIVCLLGMMSYIRVVFENESFLNVILIYIGVILIINLTLLVMTFFSKERIDIHENNILIIRQIAVIKLTKEIYLKDITSIEVKSKINPLSFFSQLSVGKLIGYNYGRVGINIDGEVQWFLSYISDEEIDELVKSLDKKYL